MDPDARLARATLPVSAGQRLQQLASHDSRKSVGGDDGPSIASW